MQFQSRFRILQLCPFCCIRGSISSTTILIVTHPETGESLDFSLSHLFRHWCSLIVSWYVLNLCFLPNQISLLNSRPTYPGIYQVFHWGVSEAPPSQSVSVVLPNKPFASFSYFGECCSTSQQTKHRVCVVLCPSLTLLWVVIGPTGHHSSLPQPLPCLLICQSHYSSLRTPNPSCSLVTHFSYRIQGDIFKNPNLIVLALI